MTPTEDHNADRMTSSKEYKPGTCCIASAKILEESCRAVASSNAPKRHKALQPFFSLSHCNSVQICQNVYVKILIALSCQCVTFCCVILGCLETCCYRCGDTLISYDDTHTQLYRGGGVNGAGINPG